MTKFRKLGKRGLALFVALVLLVGMVPLGASAADTPVKTDNVTKTAYSQYNPNTQYSNTVSGWNAANGYGTVMLDDENPTATDVAFCHYWGAHFAGWANGYYNVTAISSNSKVATATTVSTKNGLVVNFEKGTEKGKTTIEVAYTIDSLRTTANIASDSQTVSGFNGYIYYTVTNDGTGGSNPEPTKPNKPTVDDVPGKSQNGYVYVKCESYPNANPLYNSTRTHAGYMNLSNSTNGWSFGEVYENDGRFGADAPAKDYPWLCDLTINQDWYLTQWNKNYAGNEGLHYLAKPDEVVKMTFVFDGRSWLYFTNEVPITVWTTHETPVAPATTTYKVVREYFYNGEKAATVTGKEQTANVGDKITGAKLAKENPAWNTHTIDGEKVEFTYAGSEPDTLTLSAAAALNVITLRYEKNEETPKKITQFTKKLVESETDAPEGVSGITYPDQPGPDGKVIMPAGGSVTLLYKLTVTGDAGAAYKVTDDGAKWVGGDPMEGTIPESGEAVIYVTKTYNEGDIEDGHLTNIAKVTPGIGDNSNTTSSERTPVEVEEEQPKTVEVPVTVKVRFEGLEGVFGVCTHPEDFSLIGTKNNPTGATFSYYAIEGNDHGDDKEDDGTPFVTFAEAHGFEPWTVELGKEYTVQFTEDYYTVDGYTCVSIDEKKDDKKHIVTRTVTFTENDVTNGYEFVITNVYEKTADPDPETAIITLNYEANGGTGSMDADSQEVAVGASASFTVKENAFTHQGYTFTGWNTAADGSGETVAADSIFTTAVNATLYAQWENNDPDPTDPGPGPVDPDPDPVDPDPVDPPKPPVVIVTPEPVATPTPSAEPTAEPTDDPGVDIPDPTQPPLGPGPSDDPGTDIPDEDPPMGDNPILNLVDHYHYLVGYPDGSIRPGANITRAEVAEVFYRLMTADARVANWATGNSYSDVIDTAWYTDAINVMSKAGIVNGYEDGTARPNRAITRAEFAMIASQFLADYVEDPGTTTFTDIQGHWAESAIRKVQSIGWVNGDAGTTNFRPNDKITRAEAAVIFNNMLERTPDAEHLDGAMKVWPDNDPGAWYYAAMQEATNSHYYTGNEETESEEWAEVFEHDWVTLKAYWKANAGQSPEE
ncbi:S-layer homology domain-containing protein [Acutalibacter caecimuris]|uniref:S-layer homology domain-containing protein n=1 Tax=Acutalibacter caecimuris TaxID=3093657 RepID=UPI002AC944B2|nr:S-layer homology domain-containing protein [Acutalibacter sp. M00118]